MIDARAVAQEVQEQLAAAVQKRHEQFRRGQEQIRKGRESMVAVVRAGSQLAQAVRPTLPAHDVQLPTLADLADRDKLRASGQEFAGQVIARQRKAARQVLASQRRLSARAQDLAGNLQTAHRDFTGRAQELADQVYASRRDLAGKAVDAATPFVIDGVARLTQVANTLARSRRGQKTSHAGPAVAEPAGPAEPDTTGSVSETGTATDTEAALVEPLAAQASGPVGAENVEVLDAPAGATEARRSDAGAAKAGTAKTGTAKTGRGKPARKPASVKASAGTSKSRAAGK